MNSALKINNIRRKPLLLNSLLYLAGFIFFLSSCQESLEYDYSVVGEPVILIEAKISTDTTEHYVFISETAPLNNGNKVPVANAEVEITGGGKTFVLSEKSNGHYVTSPDVFGEIGVEYELKIWLENGEIYQAKTFIPNTPEIDSVKFLFEEFENFDIYFHNLYFHGLELAEEGNAYLWNVYLNDTLYNDSVWKTTFVEDEAVNGNYIGINPVTGKSDFAIYQIQPYEITADTLNVLVEMESIPLAYYDFWFSLMQQTVWVGSPFDANKADPKTNITNGAIGYFYGTSIKRKWFTYVPSEESKNIDQPPF